MLIHHLYLTIKHYKHEKRTRTRNYYVKQRGGEYNNQTILNSRNKYLTKSLLFLLFLLFTSSIAFAQPSFADRMKKSDIVIEGKVIKNESFWDAERTGIYTANTIELTKIFKGDIKGKEITLITSGGKVADEIVIVTHHFQINDNAEGIFFLEKFPKEFGKSNEFIARMEGAFISYDTDGRLFHAYDGKNNYTNPNKEIYPVLEQAAGKSFVQVAKNTFEQKIEQWIEQNMELLSPDANTIEFSFENIAVTGTSEINFDIYVKSYAEGIRFANSELYLQYTTEAFGESVVTNEKLEAEKKDVIENDVYTLQLSDETNQLVKILIQSGLEPNQLYPLSLYAEKFLHIKMDVENFYELASLSFDNFLMTNNSIFYDPGTGEYFGFEKVGTSDPFFPFLMPQITGFSPASITAGTGDILTITGTGFGTTKGKVIFTNATQSPSPTMEAQPMDIDYWSDVEIRVFVPSVETGIGTSAVAGSGEFIVETVAGNQDSSNPLSPLDIRYAVTNIRNSTTGEAKRVYLVDAIEGDGNENGTLTFKTDLQTSSISKAMTVISKSLCDWNNATSTKWELNPTPLPYNASWSDNDNMNLIYMASNTDFTMAMADVNATAYTRLKISHCFLNPQPYYIEQVDILLRNNLSSLPTHPTGWYSSITSSLNPPPNEMDLYSVILHELGHVHMLKHALPNTKLMFFQLNKGQKHRTISTADKNGGSDVLTETSILFGPGENQCNPPPVESGNLCNVITDLNNDNIQNDNINTYPNPFKSNLVVKFETRRNTDFTLKIIDLAGNSVMTKNYFDKQIGMQEINIAFPRDMTGLFILKLIVDNKIYSRKIIKL